MLKDNIISEEKRLNNIYTVLRMSILLGKSDNLEEEKRNLEDVVVKLDKLKQDEYNKKLESVLVDTNSIEEEKERLMKLVELISIRSADRKKFEEDFNNVVGKDIYLDSISYVDKLDQLKDRLSNIDKYLENNKNIKKYKEELKLLNEQLASEYNEKKNYEVDYKTFNDRFIIEIDKIIQKEYKKVENKSIELELEKNKKIYLDKEKSYLTLEKAYVSLSSVGLDSSEESEYYKFVEDAKIEYEDYKEKYKLLNIYNELNNPSLEYEVLLKIHEQVHSDIVDLNDISEGNLYLSKLNKFDKDQEAYIKDIKEKVFNINKLQNKILFKERVLKNSEKEINNESIKSILREFKLIEDKEKNIEKTNTPELSIEKQNIIQKEVVRKDNTIIDIKPYLNSNLKEVTSKCMGVLVKVCEALNPKLKVESVVTPIEENKTEVKSESISINKMPEIKMEDKSLIKEVMTPQIKEVNDDFSFDGMMPDIPVENNNNVLTSPINNDFFFPEIDDTYAKRRVA